MTHLLMAMVTMPVIASIFSLAVAENGTQQGISAFMILVSLAFFFYHLKNWVEQ